MADTEYGGSANIYDMLGGDDDAPASNPKQAAAAKPAQTQAAQTDASRGGRGGRGGRGASRGGRGGRGGRGAASTGSRPPKREFERHSGTGRGRETRRQGHGRYGWGSDNAETNVDGEPAAVAVATTDAAPTEEAAAAPEQNNVAAEPEEEEDNTLSWEQYQAKLEAKRVAEDQKLQSREVDEEDDSFKPAIKFTKTDDDVLYGDVQVDKSSKKKGGKEKEKKKTISLDEFVKTSASGAADADAGDNGGRGFGGRGGRGGFRGGRGGRGGDGEFRGGRGGRGGPRGGPRGAPRGGRGGRSGPNISDESAFPSLSAAAK